MTNRRLNWLIAHLHVWQPPGDLIMFSLDRRSVHRGDVSGMMRAPSLSRGPSHVPEC
ncbi:hypothetical protein METHP14_10236 [Pseudomonas sp. P14-2025]